MNGEQYKKAIDIYASTVIRILRLVGNDETLARAIIETINDSVREFEEIF